MVPGRRFSTTTSARSASRRKTLFPSGAFRSSASERLLRLSRMKLDDSPSRKGAVSRTLSPPRGFSTLTTSARVLLQDFTGVPAVVDLAAMRSAMERAGKDARKIDPLVPADLVIDHSVQVDAFGSIRAYDSNILREYERNYERYALLRWAQQAFNSFSVVPPGM